MTAMSLLCAYFGASLPECDICSRCKHTGSQSLILARLSIWCVFSQIFFQKIIITLLILGELWSRSQTQTNPRADYFQYHAWGRKGLVDIVHIPKVSLPLIQTCELIRIHTNFSRGQRAASASGCSDIIYGDKCCSRR